MFRGAILKKAEANQLVRSLLSAISIQTQETIPTGEDGIVEDDESMSQALKQLAIEEKGKKKIAEPTPGQSGLNKNLQQPPKEEENSNPNPKQNPSKKVLCKFYKNGRCKFGTECKFDHPKMCYKFKQFGDKKFNDKGCTSDCSYFHPNVCRDSQKSRTCSRDNCRFFHLNGTKKSNFSTQNNSNNSSKQNGPSYQSKNRFDCLRENSNSDNNEPEIDQNALSKTLEAIMREIADLRTEQKKYQNHNQSSKNSSRSDWRDRPEPEEDRGRSTQSQRRAWESQDNNRSQEDSRH